MVIGQIEAFSGLAQYGVAGFFILALLVALWTLYNKQTTAETRMYEELTKVKEDYNKLVISDRDKIKDSLDHSTAAINSNSQVMQEIKILFEQIRKGK